MSARRLSDEARAALDAPDAVRLQLIRKQHFVRHPRLLQLTERMEQALEDFPTGGDSHLLVIGDSGIGKTSFARRFARKHGFPEDSSARTARVPVLYTNLAGASAKGFFRTIFEQLNAPPLKASPSATAEALFPLVLRLCRAIELKMLIIDEVHHASAGPDLRVFELLNYLKVLGNELGITIVGLGIADALATIQLDPQMARRFEPLPLNRWRPSEEAEALLEALEARLPLRKESDLSQPKLAEWILSQSEGLTSEIVTIIRRGAREAIATGAERIDLPMLRGLRYIPLSMRKKRTEEALKEGRPA